MFSKLHPLRAGVQVAFGQLRLRLRFRPCLACGSEPVRAAIVTRKSRSRPANGKADRPPAGARRSAATEEQPRGRTRGCGFEKRKTLPLNPHPLDRANIPGCTYCHPQIASVGLTEAKAKEAGHAVKAGTFPFIGNGKAIALGEAEGFVKTVFDAKTGELLGAHMIGAEVTEMIQGFVVGKTLETTEAELMQTVFPHPTISESMHESVLASYGRALHI